MCTDQLRVPLGDFKTKSLVRKNVLTLTDTTYRFKNPQSNLASVINLDASYALIRDQDGDSNLNRKFISDLSPRSLDQLCTPSGNTDWS